MTPEERAHEFARYYQEHDRAVHVTLLRNELIPIIKEAYEQGKQDERQAIYTMLFDYEDRISDIINAIQEPGLQKAMALIKARNEEEAT